MVIQEAASTFRPAVDLTFSGGQPDKRELRRGGTVGLVARFRDFLGEPTNDTGRIVLFTTHGTLSVPGVGRIASEIAVEPGEVATNPTGELLVVFRPGREFGNVTVTLSCNLGQAALEIAVPAPSGFALAEMLESVIYAFLVAMIIRIFFFQTFWIPSGSMEPTLHEGDRIIANKLIYRLREPERGEVVIFRVFQPAGGPTGVLTLEEAEERARAGGSHGFRRLSGTKRVSSRGFDVQDYIKRVVGLPGDMVEVDGGAIYVNGEELVEKFETRAPDYSHYGPITVPPGEVFVLGDNRSNSQDSHVIGTVPIRNIEGRAEAVFWPPNRIGLIPQG